MNDDVWLYAETSESVASCYLLIYFIALVDCHSVRVKLRKVNLHYVIRPSYLLGAVACWSFEG